MRSVHGKRSIAARITRFACWALCGSLLVARAAGESAEGDAPLRPWAANPWYWSYHGEPVLLLGGSDDDNLFQWPEDQLIAQLDRLAAAGGNVIRNTMSDRNDKGFELYPFLRREDGTYDLDQWNSAYWDRFDRLLRETARRSIFVQIEVWDRFDYTDARGADHWQRHPYHPANNINYGYEEAGFARRYPDHPGQNKQPFFFTTEAQRNNRVVLRYQERFVDKLLELSLPYDHVLYCIDNETRAEPAWGEYWAERIKRRAAEAGVTRMVTEMWDDWNLKAARHRQTFDHPERYDFVDVSQNNHNRGQLHWDNFLFVRDYLAGSPRPMNTTKIYGADGSRHGHSAQDAVERFWRHLLAGGASVRFHRPDSGLGLNDRVVACLQAARKLESVIPAWTVNPANELLGNREDNEAYLAADPGRAYLLYFPSGGEVTLDLSVVSGEMELRWMNIDLGEWEASLRVVGGSILPIASLGNRQYMAAILRE